MKYDENISLVKECSVIIQHKLPPKLIHIGRFNIRCFIGSLTIGHALCDLGESINLMPISMMRKLNYREPKPIQMTLTLDDQSFTNP